MNIQLTVFEPESMSRLSLVVPSAWCDARQTLFVGPKSAQKALVVLWCGPGRL
ncbi:hypothetical protein [Photobacterium sp. Hal280]|uniref:hypothetical protein n=1 Tax=Photobacterium sp. Hal280 TaxID=3035163 RepID=UPI00301B971F